MSKFIYNLYFKLTSVSPFGALDLKVRRVLGALFNDASGRSNLEMIKHLGLNRQLVAKKLIADAKLPDVAFPELDIVLISGRSAFDLESVLDSLGRQSYPSEKITLTVILLDESPEFNRPILPNCFSKASYLKVNKSQELFVLTNAMTKLKASYFMLMRIPRVLSEHCLKELLRECMFSLPTVGLWELCPTLNDRSTYYDPITLEVPFSTMEIGIVNREKYNEVGGFNVETPLHGQGLDLSIRLYENGVHLKNLNKPELLEGSSDTSQITVQTDGVDPLASARFVNRRSYCWPKELWQKNSDNLFEDALEEREEIIHANIKVSIITRTYAGREHWLRESVCSVLNQTHRNIELIVVEDGSTEHRDFINAIQARLEPEQTVKYLSQEKKGKSHAGNLGLAAANGQFICFLDDDDLLFANHIEQLLGLSLSNNSAGGAYSLAWEVQTSAESDHSYFEEYYEVPKFTKQSFCRDVLKKYNIWPIQSILFSRRLYDRYGGFDVDREFLEDWELWLRYTEDTEFLYLPRITSMYRTPADPYLRVARVSDTRRRAVN